MKFIKIIFFTFEECFLAVFSTISEVATIIKGKYFLN